MSAGKQGSDGLESGMGGLEGVSHSSTSESRLAGANTIADAVAGKEAAEPLLNDGGASNPGKD